jgi:hypothetical protein
MAAGGADALTGEWLVNKATRDVLISLSAERGTDGDTMDLKTYRSAPRAAEP